MHWHAELNANWEKEFFSSLSASTSQNSQDDDSDEDIVEVNAESKEPKVKSLKEAMIMLEDVTEYLTSENLTEMANDLSKVLSNIQSTWLSRKLKASAQSKVTDFFKWFHSVVSQEQYLKVILVWDYDKWWWGFFRMNLLQLQLRNLTTCSRKNACFSLYIDKTCVRDVFFWEPA